MNKSHWLVCSLLLSTAMPCSQSALAQVEADSKVRLIRVPDGGLQPQVVVGGGQVHLLYFDGDPTHGDLYYVRSSTSGESFSEPLRVGSQPGSAVAVGTIRGGQIALGKHGRIHAAWNGSSQAKPKGPENPATAEDSAHNGVPMLYARLDDSGTSFEPQRNLMTRTFALDGGGSIAADGQGNVYVAWHASSADSPEGEAGRRVWMATSRDSGKTFSPEQAIQEEPTGACGCCGMRILASERRGVFALFRSATRGVQRDIYLLASEDARRFEAHRVHPWQVGTCPMSTMSLAESGSRVLCAWETDGQVYYGAFDSKTKRIEEATAAPGGPRQRKHPVLAENASGETILVWTEGTGWQRGGSLAWQVFDSTGEPTAERGRKEGIPTWSFAAVFAGPEGGFVVLY